MAKYLFNGVELPALPEWDKTTYPYATMLVYDNKSTDAQYYDIYFTAVPIFYNPTAKRYLTKADCNAIVYRVLVMDGKYIDDVTFGEVDTWYKKSDKTFTANTETAISYIGSPFKPFWANYDIINYSDNSVVVEGSNYGTDTETPEAAPVSPYLPKNGAWQKQDDYKCVGGQWVKQPQGAFEVEGGAWSALS